MAIGRGSRSDPQNLRRHKPWQRKGGQIARIGLPALLVLSIAACAALVFASLISHTTTSAASEGESEPSPIEVIAEHGVGDGYPATEVPIGNVTDIAADAAGNVYFVDNVHLRVRRIDAEGIVETVFNGHSMDVPSSPRAVALDPQSGALYVADDRANRVWVIRDGVVEAFAGSGAYGFGGDGGPAAQAELRRPNDLAVGADGTVYIADMGNSRIRAVAPDGTIDTVAGDLPLDIDGNEAWSSSSLYGPEFVALGSDGSLYVVDRQRHRLQRLLADGHSEDLSRWGALISGLATTADGALLFANGPVIERRDETQFRFGEAPHSFTAVAPFGPDAVIAYDTWAHRLYRIERDGTETLVGGNGTEGRFGDGGPANGASFSCYDVAVNGKGEIVLSDPFNSRIAIIYDDGTIATVAGGGHADGAAVFETPAGIAIDTAGALYVADCNLHRVVKVNPDGTAVAVAGDGIDESRGDGGPAIEASLDCPSDVVVGASGELFISEARGRRIRRIDASGTISTVATLSAQPHSLALDSNGNLVATTVASIEPIMIPQSSDAVTVEITPDILQDGNGGGATALLAGADGSLVFAAAGKVVVAKAGLSEVLPFALPDSVAGMAFDLNGDLILCDATHQRILRIGAAMLGQAGVQAPSE